MKEKNNLIDLGLFFEKIAEDILNESEKAKICEILEERFKNKNDAFKNKAIDALENYIVGRFKNDL